MIIATTPGALSKFGRTPWNFQVTFNTPLQSLDAFVSTILADNRKFEGGSVTIDKIVFEPKNLNSLVAAYSGKIEFSRDWTITVEGLTEVRKLLQATLADWVNFLFVPAPKPFVIYADHDEFTTFYANTRSNLNLVMNGLLEKGFKQVSNYQRVH